MARTPVTLADVAHAAGVTRLTAHRALHGQRGVSEETRQRIVGIKDRLGYRPNGAARAMRKGRYAAISLIISKTRDRGFVDRGLLEGIADEADRHGLHLALTALSDDQLDQRAKLPKAFRDGMVDGLLLNYHFDAPEALEDLIDDLGLPAIWLNADRSSSCVRFDDHQAGILATRHLLTLGHSNIAYADYHVGWKELPSVHYSNRDRAAGYVDAMTEAGLQPRILRPQSHLLNPIDPIAYTHAWLDRADAPTAVITMSSDLAVPIFIACAQLRLSIPHDLSLVAIATEVMSPWGFPFTIARLSTPQLGSAAVSALRQAITGRPRRPPTVLVAASIEVGTSASTPRSR